MLSLTVQTLDGHILDVVVDPAGCVKDIRKYLAEQYALSNCALYLQVRLPNQPIPLASSANADNSRMDCASTGVRKPSYSLLAACCELDCIGKQIRHEMFVSLACIYIPVGAVNVLQARQLSMKTSIADLELQDGAQLVCSSR